MMRRFLAALACLTGPALAQEPEPVTLTIATVDNPDMARMQALSGAFLAEHPGLRLEWVVLDEGTLRRQVGTEIALGGSRYDVLTLGTYEVPIWGGRGWLVPLDDLPAAYEVEDLLPPIREALSLEGTLYAVPFYGESSMTIHRADLLARAGVAMPEAPTWDDIRKVARAVHDPEAGPYGICLRGKPGWGENVALLTAMANSLGGRWFDEAWRPELDGPAWRATLDLYLELLALGPPGAEARGFNETVALFRDGRCGLLIDATVAASALEGAPGTLGYALAPDAGLGRRASWLWAWALAVPASSDAVPEARAFVA
ncbi:sorbitol/mannitol transport system substrate-binding protein [Rubellimicrobium aerolatum]|nr:extracellular solute-binding protein [Rubellimicrobium aerolatum]MBP1805177.1 sorbitol/mannitol transport system substrate-binding protein [Rubellimicrobium aerolatum]